MTTALQLRRGTTTQHNTFTGAAGEVTVDTTKKTVVVHDGTTAGGTPLAREAVVNTGLAAKADTTYVDGRLNTTFAFKNRIINGDMRIDQRNAGGSIGISTSGPYSVDRWGTYASQNGRATIQQNAGSVTPPPGFVNYLGVTSSSAYSVTAGDIFQVFQHIEGFNVADLGWGTANAQPVTLSFWVRSSLTGTFAGSVYNSGGARSYPFTYTISASNTWEKKSVTIAGDTTGTWLRTNGLGTGVNFTLGAGSTWNGTANSWNAGNFVSTAGATSVVGTNGATFYLTGVQLEVGSSATPFDTRAYGTELALCQRYFEILSPAYVMLPWSSGSQVVRSAGSFQVTKRASPTISMGTKNGGTGTMGAASTTTSGVVYFGSGGLGDVIGYDLPRAEIEL